MFIRIMITFMVIAIAAPFMIPGPNGTPIMTIEMLGFSKPAMPSLGGGSSSSSTSVELYRYQDADGVWHYGDSLPDGAVGEVVEVRTDANNMQAPAATSAPSAPNLPTSPVSGITNAAQLVEDAQAVQQQLDARTSSLDESLQSIR